MRLSGRWAWVVAYKNPFAFSLPTNNESLNRKIRALSLSMLFIIDRNISPINLIWRPTVILVFEQLSFCLGIEVRS